MDARPLIILAASLGLTSPLVGEELERWKAHATVGVLDNVRVRIHWHESSKELREAARTSSEAIMARGLHGFSILRRHTQTGEYTCDVFVVEMKGARVDNDRTMTFGHELLHCFGLSHEDDSSPLR